MSIGDLRKELMYIRDDTLENAVLDFRDWAEKALQYMTELEGDKPADDLEEKIDGLKDDIKDLERKVENLDTRDEEDEDDEERTLGNPNSPATSGQVEKLLGEIADLRDAVDDLGEGSGGSNIQNKGDIGELLDRVDALDDAIQSRLLRVDRRCESIEWALRTDVENIAEAIRRLNREVMRLRKLIQENVTITDNE